MKTYAWRGVDAQGRPVRGKREAASETQLRDLLLGERVTPTAIDAAEAPAWAPTIGGRVGQAEAGAFAADLARFIQSGLSLSQSLQIMETSAEKPALAALAHRLREELMSGRPLSAALATIPGQSGRYLQSLAKAGEATGRLADILTGGAKALRAAAATRRRLVTMIIYPLFVLAMALGAILLFAFAVLPALEPAFEGTGTLPATTRLVLAGGAALRLAAPLLGALAAGMILALVVLPAARALALRGLYALLSTRAGLGILPDTVFGGLAQRLSIAIAAGVPLATAFRVSVEAIGVDPLRKALEAEEPRLREGARLSDVFAAIPATPRMLLALTRVGENAADLPRVLAEAGETLTARAQEKTERLISLLTPAVVLLIGVMVGGVVLVVFQGLMSISDMVDV